MPKPPWRGLRSMSSKVRARSCGPGDRAALTPEATALPTPVQHLNQDDIASTKVGRDISNVFRRVLSVLANDIDQGETGNGFRLRSFATQGTHGADTAV